MQAVIFTFLEFEFPSKNLSLVRLVSTNLSEFFEKKIEKRRGHEGIVPLVAPEQGASLPWCKDVVCSSLNVAVKKMNTTEHKFGTRRHVNRGKQHLLIDT
jgi:hypothetical protein